jgi:hypothetical protein
LTDGPLAASMGIGYMDGVHPSLVVKMKNRIGSGAFNMMVLAYDFNGTSITQKWKWKRGNTNAPDGHQIRIVDVDQDGKDEFVDIGFVLNGDGTLKYTLGTQGVVHGDRYQIGDLDPDRPGLEGYGVQQDNPSGLIEYYYDAATGQILHTYFTAPTADNGRGAAGDVDPNYRGYEYWSFYGIKNSSTPIIGQPPVDTQITQEPDRPWPNFRIFWDGDVLSENLNETKVEKWNPTTHGVARLLSAHSSAYGATDTWRGAPTLYGDILGDWREEIIYEKGDHTQLLVFTTTTATSMRIYSLAQDPEYRNSMTIKGYYQSNMLDYYLGDGMTTPPKPNFNILGRNDAPRLNVAPSAVLNANKTAATLNVLGTDDGGAVNLTYSWATFGTPPASVNFSGNGNNAAKTVTATFSKSGTYVFLVTITDAEGLSVTSIVNLTVDSIMTGVNVSPSSATLNNGQSQLFAATAQDQFGNALAVQPTVEWTLDAGSIGSIASTGIYTAPTARSGTAMVRAQVGAINAAVTVNVSFLKGDFNLNGSLDAADVSAMLRALTNRQSYQSSHELTNADFISLTDMNGDGELTNRDLQPLLDLLAEATASTLSVMNGTGSVSPTQLPASSQAAASSGQLSKTVHTLTPENLPTIISIGGPNKRDRFDIPVALETIAARPRPLTLQYTHSPRVIHDARRTAAGFLKTREEDRARTIGPLPFERIDANVDHFMSADWRWDDT